MYRPGCVSCLPQAIHRTPHHSPFPFPRLQGGGTAISPRPGRKVRPLPNPGSPRPPSSAAAVAQQRIGRTFLQAAELDRLQVDEVVRTQSGPSSGASWMWARKNNPLVADEKRPARQQEEGPTVPTL